MAFKTTPPPSNALPTTLFIIISLTSIYYMRISPATYSMATIFEDIVTTPLSTPWYWPTNNVLARRTYTGIPPIDYPLVILATAFLPGSGQWDRLLWLLHVEFLVTFGVVVGMLNVEAGRRGMVQKWVSYTALWATIYQNIGSAVILPIYYIYHANVVSLPTHWTSQSLSLPSSLAKTLLPALLIGYFLPTIPLLWPMEDQDLKQRAIAFWQGSPIYANAVWWVLSKFASDDRPPPASSKPHRRPDLPYLRILFATLLTISTIVHLAIAYDVVTAARPGITFSTLYLPHWRETFLPYESLHYIFQVDFWGCYLSSGLWCLVAVRDLRNLGATNVGYVTAALGLVGAGVLGGPGAALGAFRWWREEKLALIKEDGKGK